MSENLVNLYTQQFTTNVQLLLQQKGSKLRNLVMTGNYVGEAASVVDQVGAVAANVVSGRFSDMPRTDAAVDRRWVYPTAYDINQLVDSFDKLKIIGDPQGVYSVNAQMALGRAMDDVIIEALFGTAKTGKAGGTSTTFPAGQQIAQNFGAAGNTGLTVAKLREALRIHMANEVDLESDPLTCVVTAKQHDNLLAEAQIISTDFNDRPVLVDGKLSRFLGINFVHCERLKTDASSYRRIPVFAKSGMHMGMWNDIQARISQRNDIQGEPWQVYTKGVFGATRTEEKKVVEIKCAE